MKKPTVIRSPFAENTAKAEKLAKEKVAEASHQTQPHNWTSRGLNSDVPAFNLTKGFKEQAYNGMTYLYATGPVKRQNVKKILLEIPESLAEDIARSCKSGAGGLSMNTALIILCDYALAKLKEHGTTLGVDVQERYTN